MKSGQEKPSLTCDCGPCSSKHGTRQHTLSSSCCLCSLQNRDSPCYKLATSSKLSTQHPPASYYSLCCYHDNQSGYLSNPSLGCFQTWVFFHPWRKWQSGVQCNLCNLSTPMTVCFCNVIEDTTAEGMCCIILLWPACHLVSVWPLFWFKSVLHYMMFSPIFLKAI